MRTLRWMLFAALALSVAGAAWAGGGNCQSGQADQEKASVKSASGCATQQAAAGCCAKGAKGAQASAAAACPTSASCPAGSPQCKAKAEMTDCTYCGFRKELGASAGKVSLSTTDTRDGVIVVFAAASKADVTTAQALAAKAYAMMSGPAHCSATKAKMAEKSCQGCQAGLDAFANADVKMENTEEGARAVVVSTDKNNVAKLHSFFQNLQAVEKADAKG